MFFSLVVFWMFIGIPPTQLKLQRPGTLMVETTHTPPLPLIPSPSPIPSPFPNHYSFSWVKGVPIDSVCVLFPTQRGRPLLDA